MNSDILFTPPADFNSRLDVAGCACEYEGKILLLKRAPDKVEGSTWNLPGGKVEKGETVKQAAQRELLEEAGIHAPHLTLIQTFYIRKEIDFIFHMFFAPLTDKPQLNIDLKESSQALWVTQEEAFHLPLIKCGDIVLNCFYTWKSSIYSY